MLDFSVLSSGSKANCIFVASAGTKLLIDCGLSAKRASERLSNLGVDASQIASIVVSHEHEDHVRGIPVFTKRYGAKVYSNHQTYLASSHLQSLSENVVDHFTTGEKFQIEDITFEAFSVSHDAADPVAFKITSGGKKIGVLTDLGILTELVKEQMRDVDAIVLESNHDEELLEQAPYPWAVKQRIAGRSGHLSNEKAGELLSGLEAPKIVVAAHISENSNCPKLAVEVLNTAWKSSKKSGKEPEIIAASVYKETELYRL